MRSLTSLLISDPQNLQALITFCICGSHEDGKKLICCSLAIRQVLSYMISTNTVPNWIESLRYQIVVDVEHFMNFASCHVRR
jgi:hypothetical protein